MLEKLRQWFAARSAGEQRTLKFGGVAALIVLLIAVLVPLQRSVSAASARVAALGEPAACGRRRHAGGDGRVAGRRR
jgi:hypothetical protein